MKIAILYSNQRGISEILGTPRFLELFNLNRDSQFQDNDIYAVDETLVCFDKFDSKKDYKSPLFIVVNSDNFSLDKYEQRLVKFLKTAQIILPCIHENMNKELRKLIIKSYPNRIDSYHMQGETSTFNHIYSALFDFKMNKLKDVIHNKELKYKNDSFSSYGQLFELIFKEAQLYTEESEKIAEIINELTCLPVTMNKSVLIKHIKSNFLLKDFKIDQEGKSDILLSDYIEIDDNWRNIKEVIPNIQKIFKDYKKQK